MQLLELNDLQLSWFSSDGQPVRQPGAALIEDDTVTYGEAALGRSRLAPRGYQDQHWQLLNSDSLALTAPGVKNNADLIYRHLKQLVAASAQTNNATTEPTSAAMPLVCAVPGTATGEQLSLLLGIAQEAGITISTFVNSALLYSLDKPLPENAWCIDVHNRRGILTELHKADDRLNATNSSDLPLLGMNGIIDGWLDLLVDQFVARSRFDPLRVAETEQQLFDQVRAWRPEHGSFNATVDHQNSQRAVNLSFEEISGRAQQRYRSAQAKLPTRSTVVLTPTASALPGFALYLSGHGHTVINADADEPLTNAMTARELSHPEAVHFVTSLGTTTATVASATDSLNATHVLAKHTATPLSRLAQTLATLAGTDASGYRVTAPSDAVLINGQSQPGDTPLRPGDQLQIDGTSYLCIRVNDGPAA